MCNTIPGLTVIQSTTGEHFLIGSHAVRFIAEQTVETSKATWSKLVNKYACLKPSKDLQEAHNSTDWAFHYKTKAGQTTVALRIPGIEFVVQNMTGQKASANREKFLLLIEDWKKQQASVLGKRPATAAAAAGTKVARIEGGGWNVASALVTRIAKPLSAVSGAVTALNTKMDAGFDRVEAEVKTGFVKVEGEMKQGTTEFKKLAASVDAQHRHQLEVKDAQIKKLQEDKQTLKDANERQRLQIAKMNKERDEILLKPSPPPSDSKLNALSEKVDGLSRTFEIVHKVAFNSREKMSSLGKEMQRLQAADSANSQKLEEVRVLLAAIAAAIAP
jgi:hypothetical protein